MLVQTVTPDGKGLIFDAQDFIDKVREVESQRFADTMESAEDDVQPSTDDVVEAEIPTDTDDTSITVGKYGEGEITIRNADGTTTPGWQTGNIVDGKYEYYKAGELDKFQYATEEELDGMLESYQPTEEEPQVEEDTHVAPQAEVPIEVVNNEDYEKGVEAGKAAQLSDAELERQITSLRDATEITDFGRGWLAGLEHEQQRRAESRESRTEIGANGHDLSGAGVRQTMSPRNGTGITTGWYRGEGRG